MAGTDDLVARAADLADAALEAAAAPAGRTTSLPRERIPVGSAGARTDG